METQADAFDRNDRRTPAERVRRGDRLAPLRGLFERIGHAILPAKRTQLDLFGLLLFVAFGISLTVAAILAPIRNWDMIPYVALLLQDADPAMSLAAIHSGAYEAVRAATSEGTFLVLTEDRPYRIAQYADAQAFGSMLPFYEMKSLYVALSGDVARFLGPVAALQWISIASGFAIMAMTLVAFLHARAARLLPVVLAAFAVCGLGTLMRLATPDALAAAFLLGAMLLFVLPETMARQVAAVLLIVAAVLTRPDTVLFVVTLAAFAWLYGTRQVAASVALAASVAAYLLLTGNSGHPGWWVHLWLTQIEYVPTVADFDPPFSVSAYLYALGKASVRAISEEVWPILTITVGLGTTLAARQKLLQFRRIETVLLLALLMTVVGKFLVFPVNETRFHAGLLLPAIMIVLLAANRSWSEASGPRET